MSPYREEYGPCDPRPPFTMFRRSWTNGAAGITVPGGSGALASSCSGLGCSWSAGGEPTA